MTASLLALASSLVYGGADFLGGLAARRSPILPVVVLSQLAGLVVLAAALLVLPAADPQPADLAWGTAGGLAGGIGVALLYRALAVGTMSAVAPVTAVCALAVPVLGGLGLGERPSAAALAGVGVAVAAIALVSQEGVPGAEEASRRGVPLALAAGVAIGVFFVLLERTGPEAGLWPLLPARAASVALFGAVALGSRQTLRPAPGALPTIVAAGILDMLANVLYLLAVRQGLLSVVATLSSLYPASTVILARVVLGERLRRVQRVGLACAALAIGLIVGG